MRDGADGMASDLMLAYGSTEVCFGGRLSGR